ncbi:aldehyde dehydrogenase (NADP(+)) [Thalassotalea euphylliae]|uniref:aldehyde dehydrogenase (NADP(+)) n=1 Tax=Thalassotalea euphylliae TaxID=1655234 RepID=UPI00362AC913
MNISGKSLIAGQWLGDTSNGFRSTYVADNKPSPHTFANASEQEVEKAISAAHQAFMSYSSLSAEKRATFLQTIGEEIVALGDDLVTAATSETGLPAQRIIGERGRTVGQLNLFANLLLSGEYQAAVDHADPLREPLPKPDTRLGYLPLGVVAVFGASNFPLAFSTAGGDTASALAAGCPVVMKAHTAHPQTSELVAQAIQKAVQKCGLDAGVFSLIQGENYDIASQIVKHPFVKAVGFTGSERVGMILQRQINERLEPIPFYGELGSTNPQFLLPNKIASGAEGIAEGLVNSLMMGVGQFCTSPGVWLLIEDDHYARFESQVAKTIEQQTAGVMLSAGIAETYQAAVTDWQKLDGVELVAHGQSGDINQCCAAVFATDFSTYQANPSLQEEVFGACALIVKCQDIAQLEQYIAIMRGNLTASIHGTDEDLALTSQIAKPLVHRVGRVIYNQMPTGVEVCDSMNHGGPFPAATDVRTTSVGTRAIDRYRRPICYQNFPQALLPELLRD